MCCSFTSEAPRIFVALQFGSLMTWELFKLVKEGKYWKLFDDRYMFGDELFYLICRETCKSFLNCTCVQWHPLVWRLPSEMVKPCDKKSSASNFITPLVTLVLCHYKRVWFFSRKGKSSWHMCWSKLCDFIHNTAQNLVFNVAHILY